MPIASSRNSIVSRALADRDRLPIAVLELAKRDVPSVIGLVEQALIDSSEVLSWVENS